MKIVVKFMITLALISSYAFSASCSDLAAKYKAPDPAAKTMKQIKRWVKRKLKGSSDAAALEKCLIAGAADNPNKSQMAGK